MSAPICDRCKDTHTVWRGDLERDVMCTNCPTPCEACRSRGPGRSGGPYCASTPCACPCHAKHHQYDGRRPAPRLMAAIQADVDAITGAGPDQDQEKAGTRMAALCEEALARRALTGGRLPVAIAMCVVSWRAIQGAPETYRRLREETGP